MQRKPGRLTHQFILSRNTLWLPTRLNTSSCLQKARSSLLASRTLEPILGNTCILRTIGMQYCPASYSECNMKMSLLISIGRYDGYSIIVDCFRRSLFEALFTRQVPNGHANRSTAPVSNHGDRSNSSSSRSSQRWGR